MTNEEIAAFQKAARAFYATDVGAKMQKFDHDLGKYWANDHREDISYRRLQELDEAANLARAELRTAIEGLQSEIAILRAENTRLLAERAKIDEPTREMWAAAGDALYKAFAKSGVKAPKHHDVITSAIWWAMIEASRASETSETAP